MEKFNQLAGLFENYPFLGIEFLGNKISQYLVFFIAFFLLFIAFRVFRGIILKRIKGIIKRAKNGIGEPLISAIDSVKTPFYWFLAFYVSIKILDLNPLFFRAIDILLLLWAAYYAVIIAQILIDCLLGRYLKKEKDSGTQSAILTIGKLLKTLLWLFAALFILSNLGVNVTSLMAGLGIGGVAIAFALQNILGDLFSSFAIHFDKPFIVGDFIIVGEHMGVVESIGIKTTRLRALQGEEIAISNRELTSTRIQNFKKMKKRRIVFKFGVVYGTSVKALKKVDQIVRDIIREEKLAEFDRVHFAQFKDFSLDFEAVYYVLSGNYNEFMDTHQNILLKMKGAFEKEGIEMAFPTQTLYIKK